MLAFAVILEVPAGYWQRDHFCQQIRNIQVLEILLHITVAGRGESSSDVQTCGINPHERSSVVIVIKIQLVFCRIDNAHIEVLVGSGAEMKIYERRACSTRRIAK